MLLLTVVRRKQRRKTSQSSSKRAYAVGWGCRPRHALKESPCSGVLPLGLSSRPGVSEELLVRVFSEGGCAGRRKNKNTGSLGGGCWRKRWGRDARLQRREMGKRESVRELGVQQQKKPNQTKPTNGLLLWFGFGFKNYKIKSCTWRKQNIFGSNYLC